MPGINHDWPHNYFWWATGGLNYFDQQSIVKSTEKNVQGEWVSLEFGPNDTNNVLTGGLAIHCSVQINGHETALIGGINVNSDINNKVRNVYQTLGTGSPYQ